MTFLDTGPGLWSFVLLCLPSVFIIVDPPGAVPVFLAMTAQDTPGQQRAMARRASLIAAGVLGFFALTGNLLFTFFGFTVAALRIAGGVILFTVGTEMVSARPSRAKQTDEEVQEGIEKPDVALVPLAIPILSGPGAIATVVSLGVQAVTPVHTAVLLVSIVVTCFTAFVVLAHSNAVKKVLGDTGLRILGRIMGLILAAIAVQFVLDGLKDALPPLAQGWRNSAH
ncbi:MAG: MarC family protein [Deltaproteobacteria bacterium]|nr:MarC family protein [Deltaproteobacteria bacterium]